eukprot:3852275-Prymnesium_polylepis.1
MSGSAATMIAVGASQMSTSQRLPGPGAMAAADATSRPFGWNASARTPVRWLQKWRCALAAIECTTATQPVA